MSVPRAITVALLLAGSGVLSAQQVQPPGTYTLIECRSPCADAPPESQRRGVLVLDSIRTPLQTARACYRFGNTFGRGSTWRWSQGGDSIDITLAVLHGRYYLITTPDSTGFAGWVRFSGYRPAGAEVYWQAIYEGPPADDRCATQLLRRDRVDGRFAAFGFVMGVALLVTVFHVTNP